MLMVFKFLFEHPNVIILKKCQKPNLLITYLGDQKNNLQRSHSVGLTQSVKNKHFPHELIENESKYILGSAGRFMRIKHDKKMML